MYQGHKIVVTICARGGSKGIPKKNIIKLAGKPLLAYSIETAQQFGWADRIVVSTDDPEIKAVAEKWRIKVPFYRSAHLADDITSREKVIASAVIQAERYWQESYDIIVDLGNATPLKNYQDVRNSVKLLINTPQTNVVMSVTPAARNPYYNMVELNQRNYARLSKTITSRLQRRQDAPQVFDMNDGVYAMWKNSYLKNRTVRTPKSRIYIMPPERSIDIDRPIDLKIAELLIKQSKKQ